MQLHDPRSEAPHALPAACRRAPGAQLIALLGRTTGSLLPPGAADDADLPDEVRYLPRVEAGRVVLRRQAWSFSADRVPVLGGSETPAHYLVRLREWVLHNGIADRCVAAVRPDRPGARSAQPFFVDFTSPLLAAMFEREARHGARVILHEALPDPGGPGAGRSTEFQLRLPVR